MFETIRIGGALAAIAMCAPALAVMVSPDGRGQALIFPYYTVRPAADGAFNTYLSITNTSSSSKALKVVLREGKAGRYAGELNVFLAAADMWTAALVPDDAGMRLLSTDATCTDPAVPLGGLMVNAGILALTPDDGLGTDGARVREGYVEVFEMGVLTGTATSNAMDRSCAALRAMSPDPGPFLAPSGGVAGSANLINVANGREFTYDALALEQLAGRAYFGAALTDAVSFGAAAIDTASVVTFGGVTYWSRWARGVDAVTAVLMTRELEGEYSLDSATRSKTDWILTFPTRRHYVTRTSASAPFRAPLTASPGIACEWLYVNSQGRDDRFVNPGSDFPERSPPATFGCWSTTLLSFANRAVSTGPTPAISDVFASPNTAVGRVFASEHGWAHIDLPVVSGLQADSIAFNHSTGLTSATTLTLSGLPVVGFSAQTLDNGFIDCAGALCKGNYGGLFKLRARRDNTPR
jgi:hypothetical protein